MLVDLVASVKQFKQVKVKDVYNILLSFKTSFQEYYDSGRCIINFKKFESKYNECFKCEIGVRNKEQYELELRYLVECYDFLISFKQSQIFDKYFTCKGTKYNKEQSIELYYYFNKLYNYIQNLYFQYNELTLADARQQH